MIKLSDIIMRHKLTTGTKSGRKAIKPKSYYKRECFEKKRKKWSWNGKKQVCTQDALFIQNKESFESFQIDLH